MDTPHSTETLFVALYDELKRLAHRQIHAVDAFATLRTTELVHEAFLKLGRRDDATWEGRAHFFGAAARAMRQVLVDFARRRRSLKRGGAESPVTLPLHLSGPVDILKVAHHGSATSTTPELLSATHPKFAVISVGAHNNYGHPRREVLERLNAAHAQTFRTDEDGATTFVMNGNTVAVETFLTSAGPHPQPAGSRDSPR